MRRQPETKSSRAIRLRRILWALPGVAAIALTGFWLPDRGDDREAVVREAAGLPITHEQIDRSFKSDRLPSAVRPARPSLDEARAAALRTVRHNAPLADFYRALSELESGLRSEPVTVLHLGDSHIAADRFSGDLRELFQARFGDAGRGMMMPGFPFAYYQARGVTFARAGTWSAANSFRDDPGPYGLSGVRLGTREKGARLTLRSDEGAFEWAEVAFAAEPEGGEVAVSFGGAERTVSTAGPAGTPVRVRIDRKGRELSVTTKDAAPVSVLSWSVGQNRPGLRYVNFGIPGATADTPRRWNEALVADGLARLKPDLIVLGYGTNEGFNDHLDAPAYEARVAELIGRLRDKAPRASVLILGPPDSLRLPRFARSAGKDAAGAAPCRALSEEEARDYGRLKQEKSSRLARWHQPPSLSAVRRSLERVAESRNAQFWDWSRVMGGPCGIHEWAQADPPLAASDRVHLRSAGARRSATALFAELMAGFDAHARLASR